MRPMFEGVKKNMFVLFLKNGWPSRLFSRKLSSQISLQKNKSNFKTDLKKKPKRFFQNVLLGKPKPSAFRITKVAPLAVGLQDVLGTPGGICASPL